MLFISHSKADSAAAAIVERHLESLGYESIFLDFDAQNGIAGGAGWEQELYQKLRMADALVTLVSADFVQSRWCFAEVVTARQLGKTIIHLRLTDDDLPNELRDTQAIDFQQDRMEGFPRLAKAIERVGLLALNDFSLDPGRSPYPGLMYFDEQDAALFTGRDPEISAALDRLHAMVRFQGAHLMLIAGASGAGKSSLLRAGLVPRLKKDPERWRVLKPLRPGTGSLAEVEAWSGEKGEETLVCCIDQFEEALTRASSPSDMTFLDRFAAAVRRGGRVIFIATIRSDFLGLFQVEERLRDLELELLPLGLLPQARFAQIIEKPASLFGFHFSPGLVQRMVADAGHAEALPLLAFTLREVWEKPKEGWTITATAYDEIGGIQGAVASAARSVTDSSRFTESERAALRRAFPRLVASRESGQLIRRPASWSELPPESHRLVEQLVRARLLVSSGDDDSRSVEVAHEALFRIWPDFADWVETNAAFLTWRGRLHARMAEYAADRREDSLPTGDVLDEALRFAGSHHEDLSPDELAFIEESERVEAKRKLRHELESWRTHLDVRFAEWVESGRRDGLLLSGTALAQALDRLPAEADLVTAEKRGFIEQSAKHDRLLARRRARLKIGAKWALRVALACMGAAVVIALLRDLWIMSDASTLYQIKNETREQITTSAAWFRLGLQLRLGREASHAVEELPAERRPLSLSLMARDPAFSGDAPKLERRALHEAQQACQASGSVEKTLACFVEIMQDMTNAESPQLAREVRRLARAAWDRARESESKGSLDQALPLLRFADEVGAGPEAVALWNEIVAPAIRAGLSDSGYGCIGAYIPREAPASATEGLLDFPKDRELHFIGECWHRGLVRAGQTDAAIQVLETIPAADLSRFFDDFSSTRDVADNANENYYSKGVPQYPTVIWTAPYLRRLKEVVERRLGKEESDDWRLWIKTHLALAGDPEKVASINASGGPVDPAYGWAKADFAVARSLLDQKNYDLALSTFKDRWDVKAAIIEQMLSDGLVDRALTLLPQNEETTYYTRIILFAMVGSKLCQQARCEKGSKFLDRAERLLYDNVDQIMPENIGGLDHLWCEGAKSFARAGRPKPARRMALLCGGEEQAAVYSVILESCPAWYQRIGLLF